jgi:hypothetical protein
MIEFVVILGGVRVLTPMHTPDTHKVVCILLCLSCVVHGSKNACLRILPRKFEIVAGITVIPFVDGPLLPFLLKPTCVSDDQRIMVNIDNVTINLLNISISDDTCLSLYKLILCPNPKKFIVNRCRYAHHIVFAILQSMPQCIVDMNCESTYNVKELECKWKRQMQDEICESTQDPIQNCTNNRAGSINIQDTCYLTNSACNFIVKHIVSISISVGAIWAIVSILFIMYSINDKEYVEIESTTDGLCENHA